MAIANVFLHPNVGAVLRAAPDPPARDQQSVARATSARVAAAFANNGKGVRGDMKAVLRAVLLDPEARGDAKTDPRYGMLREPVLFIMAMLRGLDAVTDGNRLYEPAGAMGQDVFYSPSVFNYYPADYKIPGTSLIAPQFGIHNTNTDPQSRRTS